MQTPRGSALQAESKTSAKHLRRQVAQLAAGGARKPMWLWE